MRALLNTAISACLLSLAAANLAANPFLMVARADSENEPCPGEPPGEDCTCCEECGCWMCE